MEVDNQIVEQEMGKHKNWVDNNKINATPTILINGYELPYNYRIEDVVYFLGVKM